MRSLLVSLLAMMPLVANAANVTIVPKQLQKGVWVDAECKKENATDRFKDAEIRVMKCLCVADIAYVELSGIANAKQLNAFIRSGAENAANGPAEDSDERSCRGQKIEMPTGDARAGLTEYQYHMEKTFENDDLLVLAVNSWSYGEGAAHGNPWNSFYNIDKKTGKILRDSDIVGDDFDGVNAYLYAQLKKNEGSFLSDCKEYVAGDSFCPAQPEQYIDVIEGGIGALQVTQSGLSIVFNVYSVGPYASGPIEIAIPAQFVKNAAIKKLYGAKHAR